ncbi:VWA domain-containing protein [Streptomyces sp. KR80]|uniref:VWA domain-containing protein n=1 Tax=Streptomyces sp. KR80 TaxID=3457426 RepID=UPI003FCFABC4
MGIRSLLRNAFGRSRAAGNDRKDGNGVTVPEARAAEPSAPEPAPGAEDRATAATSPDPAPDSAPTARSARTADAVPPAEAASLLAAFDAAAARNTPTADEPSAVPVEAPTGTESATIPAQPAASASDRPATATDAASESLAAKRGTSEQYEAEARAGEATSEQQSTGVPPRTESAGSAPASSPTASPAAEPTSVPSQAASPDSPDREPESTEVEPPAVPAQAKTAEEPPAARVPAQADSGEASPAAEIPAQPEPADASEADDAPSTQAQDRGEESSAVDTPEPAAAAATTDRADVSGVPLQKVEATAPGLVSRYKEAGAALHTRGLAGQRATVYLVLDRSGSMRRYYKDGTVQHLAEQALALSAHLGDGTVPVVFFSTDVDGTADVSLDAYEGRIEALHADLGHMGRTNYHRAVEAVVEHHEKSGSTDPAFVIFQTDGAPTSKPAAEKALCESAKLPVFWQFIGFGEPDAKGFDFLRKLDALAVPEKRPVANAGFFHAGLEPLQLADGELFENLTADFPAWLADAREAGILPH